MSRHLFVPSRRMFLVAVTTAFCIAIVALVILSPFALVELAHFRHDWSQLSNIGQTYGAVSALVSSLALGGVIVSLLFQARDNQNAREQTTRTLQLELIKLELDDPALMTALGAPWGLNLPAESGPIREFLYVQMWVSFWGGNYTIGEMSDSNVRSLGSRELFRSEAGRTYWAAVGHVQMESSTGRRNRFFRILDEEYRKAVSSGVPIIEPVKTSNTSAKSQVSPIASTHRIRQLCMFAVTTIIGVLFGRFWYRRRMNGSPDDL
jgi:Family of unknown function (DUF6082)